MPATDEEFDYIFGQIDELMRDGNFNILSDMLKSYSENLTVLDTAVILVILTAILPAKSKIPFWESFSCLAEDCLKQRHPDDYHQMLQGLI